MAAENWEGVRQALESKLAELNEQIGSYPGPVTGCDAQFNHMLEQRSGLNAELTRLDAAAKADAGGQDLKKFLESCPFLTD